MYEDYLFALDKTKIQYKSLNYDGSITYLDATYNNLVAAGYTIKLDGEDKEVVDAATAANFVAAAGNREYFQALQTGRVTTSNRTVDGYTEVYTLDQLKQVNGNGKFRLMADMKRIDMKDRKYDSDLAALDTERNAIKQKIETLKTVAKENVERTFKLFS